MALEYCIKCDQPAIRLGLCATHYAEWIDDVYEREVAAKGRVRPIPPCWSGDARAWVEYQVLAVASSQKFRSHCTDCMPHFKNAMIEDGRCNRPETIFVIRKLEMREAELVGLNRDFPLAFKKAVRGRDGQVVQGADPKDIFEALQLAKQAGAEPKDKEEWVNVLPPLGRARIAPSTEPQGDDDDEAGDEFSLQCAAPLV